MKLLCGYTKCTKGPGGSQKSVVVDSRDLKFSNIKTKLLSEKLTIYCCGLHQTLGEEEAGIKRPRLATINGHNTHDFDVVNTQAERMF